MEVSGQLHAPAALLPWRGSSYTHWIGGHQNRYRRGGKGEKKSLLLPGIECKSSSP